MTAENIWIATISAPYEQPEYWIAAHSRDAAKNEIVERLNTDYNHDIDNADWNDPTDKHSWLRDVKPSVEVRQIEVID